MITENNPCLFLISNSKSIEVEVEEKRHIQCVCANIFFSRSSGGHYFGLTSPVTNIMESINKQQSDKIEYALANEDGLNSTSLKEGANAPAVKGEWMNKAFKYVLLTMSAATVLLLVSLTVFL